MHQPATSPIPLPGRLSRISLPEPSPNTCQRHALRNLGPGSSCPDRNGESLFAVPEGGASGSRHEALTELRRRIASLERHAPLPSAISPAASPGPAGAAWTFGAAEVDRCLPAGLDIASLHEVKPAGDPGGVAAADWAAAFGFALRLAVRRLQGSEPRTPVRPVLWCWPAAFAHEIGRPYGHGLAALGLDPAAWLFAETARSGDALWAMEEGLRSQSLALVVGVLPEAELTPARRLSLAAAEHATPCIIVTDPRASPAACTATRWRVGGLPTAAHPFDRRAPGVSRCVAALERCRQRPLAAEAETFLLEWSDETHRFRVAAAVADRADGARASRRGAG